MEKTENNVMFNTPGTSPMYEMLLFIHHWSEDFPTKSMKDSFIKKTQILLTRESKVIHAATEYFGNNKENGRLFQLFFFDLE
jgi:hypothetical protein